MTPYPEGTCEERRPWRPSKPSLAAALLSPLLGGALAFSAPAPAPDREAWRKVEVGSVTVVGTASDARLAETAVTLRALVALMPGLVPGAFGASPPLVAAVVHDTGHLARVGYPPTGPTSGRIVLAATSDEEERAGFLRAVATALGRRSRVPLPEWLVAGLGEYLSTFSATPERATLGRLVPEHIALLRAARLPAGVQLSSPRRRSRGRMQRSPSCAPRPGPSSTSCCRGSPKAMSGSAASSSSPVKGARARPPSVTRSERASGRSSSGREDTSSSRGRSPASSTFPQERRPSAASSR
ncbi:MAG: hypothetical protein IPF66_25605 [Holophagales bacterium]|nr:hypothetical protein [Holophagales bacterium]